MATKFEFDSKSDTKTLVFHDESTLGGSGSKRRSSPSVFSLMLTGVTMLSHIRELVTGPDYTHSSAASIVNSCTAVLPAAFFSNLLRSRNIDGHSAVYWAIVNNRQEALSAFIPFISKLSSGCRSELRQACMVTDDHVLLTQLNLTNPLSDESLRRSLGCPPDEIEVHKNNKSNEHAFVAMFRFKMYQKRMRIARKITSADFIGGGRIWWSEIYMGNDGKWRMMWGLRRHSLPAHPLAAIHIEAQRSKPGHARPAAWKMGLKSTVHLEPEGSTVCGASKTMCTFLSEWLMDENSPYIDDDGTLHLKLELTLK